MLPRPDRKISASLTDIFHHPDPSRNIATQLRADFLRCELQGRELPFQYSCVHRVGLMSGLGFSVPETDDGISLVRIIPETNRRYYTGEFEGTVRVEALSCDRHHDHLVPDIITRVRFATGVPLDRMTKTVEAMLWPAT